jgi:hypothetical protein
MGGHRDARKRSHRSDAAAFFARHGAAPAGKIIAPTTRRLRECYFSFGAAAAHAGRYAWLQFIFVSTLAVTAITTGASGHASKFARRHGETCFRQYPWCNRARRFHPHARRLRGILFQMPGVRAIAQRRRIVGRKILIIKKS